MHGAGGGGGRAVGGVRAQVLHLLKERNTGGKGVGVVGGGEGTAVRAGGEWRGWSCWGSKELHSSLSFGGEEGMWALRAMGIGGGGAVLATGR